MKQVLNVIKIILQLLPYLQQIIEFLEGLKEIRRVSGDDVARQIADDSAKIAKNWKEYLKVSRDSDNNLPLSQQQEINNQNSN